jgi:HK97 family phage major capsid protein
MSEELKKLTEEISKTWEGMKAKNDEVLAKYGTMEKAQGEDHQTLAKMETALDELSIKVQRAGVPSAGTGTKVDEEQAKKKALFYRYLRVGKQGLEPAERKALVSDATGLLLVPEDLEAEIYRGLPAIAVMRGLSTIRPTTVDKVARRSITEATVGWGKLEVGHEIPESELTPSKLYLNVEDLYGLVKIGEDELADAADAQLQAIIADSFRRSIAEAEDNGFTIGTGHSNSEPEGVAVDATIIASYKTNLATPDILIPHDIIGMEYDLPAQYVQGAVFLMHRQTEKMLRLVRGDGGGGAGTGPYLWQPGLQAGMPNQFDGFPVYNQASMHYPADAVAGVNVLFGNFKAGYTILDRQGMTLQRLDELYAEAGLVGFKVHFRVGGGPVRPVAFRALYNNT